jgi:hypothetical protein
MVKKVFKGLKVNLVRKVHKELREQQVHKEE